MADYLSSTVTSWSTLEVFNLISGETGTELRLSLNRNDLNLRIAMGLELRTRWTVKFERSLQWSSQPPSLYYLDGTGMTET